MAPNEEYCKNCFHWSKRHKDCCIKWERAIWCCPIYPAKTRSKALEIMLLRELTNGTKP